MMTATPILSNNLSAKHNPGCVWLIFRVAAMVGLLSGWGWVVVCGAKPCMFGSDVDLRNGTK